MNYRIIKNRTINNRIMSERIMNKFIMKSVFLISLGVIFAFNTQTLQAMTATESLEITINKLISIAKDKTLDKNAQLSGLKKIINEDVNFEAVSRRVVVKPWKKATDEQKSQFKVLFSDIIVNTYFSLLENYTDEQVLYVKEQIKREKYASVDTVIVLEKKKVPVRYKLLKAGEQWKIYDFSPEGISLISTYKKNYAPILRKNGMAGLLEEMTSKSETKAEE